MACKNRDKIRVIDRRQRVRDLMLKGVWGQREIARRLGVSLATAHRDVQAIYKEWEAEDAEEGRVRRDLAVRQLDEAGRLALEAFEQSKSGAVEEITYARQEACKSCRGSGFQGGKEGGRWCSECDGNGVILVVERVQRRVSKGPGDSGFLRIFLDSVREKARIWAITGRVKVVDRSKQVHFHQHGIEELKILLDKAPPELLLEAKGLLEKMRLNGLVVSGDGSVQQLQYNA